VAELELREVSKKIILIGDSRTGKTAIAERFVNDRFVEDYLPGTGMKTYNKNMQFIYPNLIINLKITIYDLCGQKEYSKIREMALADANAIVIVSDLSRPETVTAVPDFWIIETKNLKGGLTLTYLGNKIDIVDENSPSAELLQRIADRNGMPIFFSSARTGENVEELFQFIGKQLISDILQASQKINKEKPTTLKKAFDYIIADFCAQYGDMEKAMLIAQNQFLEAGLDLRSLTKEKMLEIIERLRMVESILLTENIANVNHQERLALIESINPE